jgi:Concanavalin A-like lectin/glucanases superfamily
MAFITAPEAHWRPHQRHPVLIQNHPIARGLKFAEVFYESKGAFVYDRVRPLIHGDVSFVSNSWAQTDIGSAMEVDSSTSNNPTTWAAASNYYTTLADFTVEMIVRHNSTGEGRYFDVSFGGAEAINFEGFIDGIPAWVFDLHYGSGRRVWGANDGTPTKITPWTVGQWYQLLFTKAGTACPTLYINGYDVAAARNPGADVCVAASISGGNIRMFGGLFGSKPHRTAASFRIWDRALTATEVALLYRDPWVIYEEAASFRRTIAKVGGSPEAATVELDLFADPDAGIEPEQIAVAGSVLMGLHADPDGSFAPMVATVQFIEMDLHADPDGFFAPNLILIADTGGEIPSVDIGGSRDEVFVQVVVTGAPDFVIEGSQDDVNFTPISPVLNYSTFWQLDPKFPYVRVRRISGGSGSFIVYYGPQEGRIDGHEKGVVTSRVRYSDEPTRTSH